MAQLRYTYTTTDDDKAKGTEVTRTFIIDGTPYERLISRNGHPLSPERERREEEKFQKAVRERAEESPEQRRKRLLKYENERRFLEEVPEAFNFKLYGQENVNGRPAYVIEATPKPEYRPHDMKSRMFTKLVAKIWIDRQDLRMAKAEATVTDTVSIGLIMARIGRGGHFELEQTRMPGGIWVPKDIDVCGTATILLIDKKNLDEKITFSDYQPISRQGGPEVAGAGAPPVATLVR